MGELLEKGLRSMGFEVKPDTIGLFDVYRNMLVEWNKKFNLTAITDEEGIDVLHFLDSATIFNDVCHVTSFCDVGSGAGFPGIPLKILGLKGEVVLFDSLGKRVRFMEEVINELGIEGCRAVHIRAEDAGRGDFRGYFDAAAARAVAKISVLSEYCLPLLKTGGMFIAMKGKYDPEEAKVGLRALEKLKGKISEIRQVDLYGSEASRTLVFIEKAGKTPSVYPRKAGTPSRRPL